MSSTRPQILASFNRNLRGKLDLLEDNSVSREVYKVIFERANEYRNYATTLMRHIAAIEDIYRAELPLKTDLELKANSASWKIGGGLCQWS
jgi:hypothetical protein